MQFRASGVAPLFLGTDGLTSTQEATLENLLARYKSWQIEEDPKLKKKYELTQNMLNEMSTLTEAISKFNRGEIELPTGAKTYVEEIVDKELYAYRTSISNKEMDKGSDEDIENEAIETYNRVFVTDHKKLMTGDKYAELNHNHLVGHPDIVCEITKMVKDAKSSWSKKTFPKRVKDAENSTYSWQVRSYLYMLQMMTGDDSWRSGEVFHCLVDTPLGLVPEWEDDSLHNMANVPDNMRLTVVPVELTNDNIKHMERRISAGIKYADVYRNELLNKNK